MPVSDRVPTLRRLLRSGCAISLTLTTWAPALSAAELASHAALSAERNAAVGSDWLAQGRSNRGGGGGGRSGGGSGGRSAGRSGGGGGSLGRPSGGSGSRPGGAGAGAIGRPAPGVDRGNRRPSGGWVNNVPPSRPGSRPGTGNRPSLPPAGSSRPGGGGNRPGDLGGSRPGQDRPGSGLTRPGDAGSNRPGQNRPGDIGGNRPGLNRPGDGSNRPEWNRPGDGSNRPANNRPDWSRPGNNDNRPNWSGNTRPNWNSNTRSTWNRSGWNRPDWVFDRRVNINTTINVRPNWWGPTWYSSRPWRWGWFYGPTTWGWWGGSSLAWGVTSLASAAIIASAINNAVSSNTSTIVVNDSPYQLVFGTVTPVGANGVSFSFLFQGEAFEATADCREGLINGRRPSNPEEAQLINAACQVAFASF